MADTINTNYKFIEPEVGASQDTWGDKLNDNWGKIDALLHGDSYTDTNANVVQKIQPDLTGSAWKIDGTAVTASAAELNLLDGVTATTAELNKVDGYTGTATELNYAKSLYDTGVTATEYDYLDGVTSNIQTQLNGMVSAVTAGSGLSGGGTSGTVTVSHADTSSQASVNNSGNTFIQDITLDTYGHITGISSGAVTVNNATLTLSAGSGLNGGGNFTANQGSDETLTFNVDSDLRGDVYYIGRDTNDYIGVETTQINFVLDGNTDARLYNNGDFHVDGDLIAYSTSISDIRLKEDIEPVSDALNKVSRLNGYTFTYKADGKVSAGVIAQEVEAVLPEAVTETELLKMDDGKEYKVVNYDALHALLIESIKELKARIEELEAK